MRRRKGSPVALLGCALAVVVGAPWAWGQEPAARSSRKPRPFASSDTPKQRERVRQFDVRHVKAELTLDPKAAGGAGEVRGTVTHTVAPVLGALTSVTLDCGAELKVSKVTAGPSGKPRNFVAASDVARLAERALLDDVLPYATLDIGGHDHLSNAQVAELYAREAGLPLRVSRMPLGLARSLALLARPVHPGVARVLAMQALPDNAFSERFDGAADLEQRFGLRLKRLPEVVREQVAAWRASQKAQAPSA